MHIMPNPPSKKRILILTADAGFGHRSAAQAVSEALGLKYPGACECTIINPVYERDGPFPLRNAMRNYDRTVTRWTAYYRLTYALSDTHLVCSLLDRLMRLMLKRLMSALLVEFRPDAILSTYHIYNPPLQQAIDQWEVPIPFFSVVTDLQNVHKMWLRPGPERIFVASQAVRLEAIACGLSGEQVIASGIPVNPHFGLETKSRQAIRRALGWDENLTTLLAVGSRRVETLLAHLQAINQSGLPLQLAAVAGGDVSLYKKLKAVNWRIPVHTYGFVERMAGLMLAADLLISKAGGLIISEGLAGGLPLLLVEYIHGQESGNVRFVCDNHAGRLTTSPRETLNILQNWLQNGAGGLHQAAANARQIGRPKAAAQVAEIIWEAIQS
jgi:UDP-N-acetylglucosamine:LPS N-acetylglucosamine transferase